MVEHVKQRKLSRISPVWFIPFFAFLIALWIGIETWRERGQEIKITFSSASDIIPGQTQIRLKDIKIGMVTDIKLEKDLNGVIVTAEIDREVSKYLSENSRFWVATPKISATEISNLGTLISGVYIVMDPGDSGKLVRRYKGLDVSPLLASDEKGTAYVLQSENLSSLDIGSPIYYRQIKVGEVTGYNLSSNQKHVDINIFVHAPHDQMIQNRSRFWNVSGFSVSLGAEGVKANMASLTSLLSGGIEFDNTASFGSTNKVEPEHRFVLFPDKQSVLEERYSASFYYMLRFSGSIKGLPVGAAVEFKGLKVGEVIDVKLASSENVEKSLHVYIAVQPQRIDPDQVLTREAVDERMHDLVSQGLRAQMNTGSLLTGSKFIDLVFMNDSEGEFIVSKEYSEIPTVNDSVSQITQKVDSLLDQIANVPVAEIGEHVQSTVSSLSNILSTLEQENTAGKIDDVVKSLDNTLEQAKNTLEEIEHLSESVNDLTAADSITKRELDNMMGSLTEAADSMKVLLNELSRHPNALIFGSEDEK